MAEECAPVRLTPAAIGRVRYLAGRRGDSEAVLRVAVKGGGCSGLSYALTLGAARTERDLVGEQDGVTLLVDRRSARHLDGVTIDFSTRNLLAGGWVFDNPHAGRSCGCGTSFAPSASAPKPEAPVG